MRVLFDTSVLVAAMLQAHPQHALAFPWLDRGRRGALTFLVAAHSLAEVYAVLSSYPTRPRLGPSLAARLVRENIRASARVITLSARDYGAVIQQTADAGLSGGVVYDALLARAAQKAKAERLLTLNPRDFLRVWPEGVNVVAGP
jgi:predicted nucleic acid-binding protein